MRSYLFVPGDSPHKLDKALDAGADALILDLEDAVAAAGKAEARRTVRGFLEQCPADAPALFVRINALDTGLAADDLEGLPLARLAGLVLPKAVGGRDAARLDHMLSAAEQEQGVPARRLRILAIATETARSLFEMGSFVGATPRLCGLTWGTEDLSAALGAESPVGADGRLTGAFALARSLTLIGAAAANVQAIDRVYASYRDTSGLAQESADAARDGFTGKLAIHPAQVPIINAAFAPNEATVRRAEAIVAAFAADPSAGVIGLDGQMLDQPHLVQAERVLSIARLAKS